MLTNAGNVWFWGTLVAGLVLGLISAGAAYAYNKNKGERDIYEAFFSGPAKDRLTALGFGIPLAPILFSEEVRAHVPSFCLLSASVVLLLLASGVGLWFYSGVKALPRPRPRVVTIKSFVPIAIQGVILSWLMTAIIATSVFLFVFPF